MSQLQSGIAAAEETDDLEALSDLRQQLSALYERHRQFYPPPSPYFRDTRDGDRPQAASGGSLPSLSSQRVPQRAKQDLVVLGQDRPQIEQEPVLVDTGKDARVSQPESPGQGIDAFSN